MWAFPKRDARSGKFCSSKQWSNSNSKCVVGRPFSRFSFGNSGWEESGRKRCLSLSISLESPFPFSCKWRNIEKWHLTKYNDVDSRRQQWSHLHSSHPFKSSDQLSKDEDYFIRLSRWKPHLFVNDNDHLSSGYITYFERKEALGDTEAGRMEAKYTLRALVNNLVTLIDKDRDSVPFYLLPTTYLNTYARYDSFR